MDERAAPGAVPAGRNTPAEQGPRGPTVLHAAGGAGPDLRRADPETGPVLMDVMMPGLDGYAAVRAGERFARPPVVAVTARAMPGDRDRSRAAGADDHVTEPVDTDHLPARMRHRPDAP
ncbi:response regulator [Kitasatospora sp. NPDC058406]|uniref:response regulator n=1 Tax=Kitasatospora sp. NPDC058406 TaxID=3346483 RepID=UPI003651A527